MQEPRNLKEEANNCCKKCKCLFDVCSNKVCPSCHTLKQETEERIWDGYNFISKQEKKCGNCSKESFETQYIGDKIICPKCYKDIKVVAPEKENWEEEFEKNYTEVEFLHGVPVQLPLAYKAHLKSYISNLLERERKDSFAAGCENTIVRDVEVRLEKTRTKIVDEMIEMIKGIKPEDNILDRTYKAGFYTALDDILTKLKGKE